MPTSVSEVQAWPALQQTFEKRLAELEAELTTATAARTAEYADWLQSQRALLTSGKLPNKFPEELKAILQRPQDQLTEAQQQALRSFWVRQQKDLKPISILATAPMFLALHPKVPANTLQEFIDYVRAKPGVLNYGSAGVGSMHHLSAVALGADDAGVPYAKQYDRGSPRLWPPGKTMGKLGA